MTRLHGVFSCADDPGAPAPVQKGVIVSSTLVLAAVTFLTAVLALLLRREIRLRRALQALIRTLLTRWRNNRG
jgi:hypothetical protein